MTETKRTFCRICQAVCGLVVDVEGDEIKRVRGDPDHPLSQGYTCSKGRALGRHHRSADRLDSPMIRRGGRLEVVSWEECLEDLAASLARIAEAVRPSAIGAFSGGGGFYDSGGFFASRALLAALGTTSTYSDMTIDTAAKPLMGELLGGITALMPNLDVERVELAIFVGTNPVVSHGHGGALITDPVVRLRELARNTEVWVLDPITSETSRLAHRHLRPRPGTDFAVFAYALRELLRSGADREYLAARATGVEELTAAVEPWNAERASRLAGIGEDDLGDLVDALRRYDRVGIVTGTGVTMAPGANVCEWMIAAIHIVKQCYDRPGGIWFNPGFLTQFDVQTPPLLPDFGSAAPGPRSRPELHGRFGEFPCVAIPDEIQSGELRALLCFGGNIVACLPDTPRIIPSLRRLEVLATFDVVHNETTALATHVLPCAGQLERADVPVVLDSLFPQVYSEYTAAVVPVGADRRPMWWVLLKLGQLLGHDLTGGLVDVDAATDDDVLRLLFAGARRSFDEVRATPGPLVESGAVFGWVHDKVLRDGRWRLAPEPLVQQLASVQAPKGLVLVPRRQPRHQNGQLRDLGDQVEIRISASDAVAHGIEEGSAMRVKSGAGTITGIAVIDDHAAPGTVSVPHGWSGEGNVNRLVSSVDLVDPLTGMAAQNGTPVSVSPADRR